jgi:hypothetical protein
MAVAVRQTPHPLRTHAYESLKRDAEASG